MMLRFLDDVMGFLYKKLVEQQSRVLYKNTRSLYNKLLVHVQEYTIIVQQISCTRIHDHCSISFLFKNTRSLFNKCPIHDHFS